MKYGKKGPVIEKSTIRDYRIVQQLDADNHLF